MLANLGYNIPMNQTNKTLKQHIALLRWVLPVAFSVIALIYQLGFAKYVSDNLNHDWHWIVEILFYGTLGPLFTFWILTRILQGLDEKDRVEREARVSERLLASITDASADAILGTDKNGTIETWNRGAELIFGYAPKDIIGQPFTTLFEGETTAVEEVSWLLETVFNEGFLRDHESKCITVEGKPITVELTASRIPQGGDNVAGGISLILRDITNRKRREEEIQRLNESLNQQVEERTQELAEKIDELARANAELKELDKMRAEFVSLVSHQIRAPLTNISGAIERIRDDNGHTKPRDLRMLSIIEEQSAHLGRLVQDVLNANLIESGEISLHPEPISIVPIIQQVVEQMHMRTKSRSIYFSEKPGLPIVYADREWVVEILTNLLDNADKYTPQGSNISIDLGADLEKVSISVIDHGQGLPQDAVELVFDKFYRTDSSDSQVAYGYGLGLYVCRLLVEAQGGSIWAENNSFGGATFTFSLPVWQEVYG